MVKSTVGQSFVFPHRIVRIGRRRRDEWLFVLAGIKRGHSVNQEEDFLRSEKAVCGLATLLQKKNKPP